MIIIEKIDGNGYIYYFDKFDDYHISDIMIYKNEYKQILYAIMSIKEGKQLLLEKINISEKI